MQAYNRTKVKKDFDPSRVLPLKKREKTCFFRFKPAGGKCPECYMGRAAPRLLVVLHVPGAIALAPAVVAFEVFPHLR
ncbi:MAG: hypothetical protein NTZ54_05980, partial [Alphaproteobacteria bacterium]|nr:hypothetical protein [Alphaproteobacteria bacterium]